MVKIIAEIGINHNGSIKLTKDLIDLSKVAGCDYVKFQKRTPDICVPEAQKYKLRSTPWGEMTYVDYKKKIEFEKDEYDEIFSYCKKIGIKFTSAQITNYSVDQLIGRQIVGICNLPSKNIAGFVSEVLVLGAVLEEEVHLLRTDDKLENGTLIG